MNYKLYIGLCLSILLGMFSPSWAASDICIQLNNEAVKEINNKNWVSAIGKLEEALSIDPSYSLATQNLATANFCLGKELEGKGVYLQALKHLHKALFFISDSNALISRSVVEKVANETIAKLGKNPISFTDRVSLGDDAERNLDFVSASVEYTAALSISENAQVRGKLTHVLQQLGYANSERVNRKN